MAGVALRGAGCAVDVHERVPRRLQAHGAGLRIVPEMAQLLQQRAGIDLKDASTVTHWFRHIGERNRVISDLPIRGQFTSWASLHRALSAAFDPARYHLGHECVGIDQPGDAVMVHFAGGRSEAVDLVVFADGILSTGRRLLAPETPMAYAGYVAWRGFAPASALSAETRAALADAVTYVVPPYSHALIYAIPDAGGREPALYNFVWYRNVAEGDPLDALMTDRAGIRRPISVPAGMLQDHHVAQIKSDAADLLAPAAAEVVAQTREPFIQALFDVEVARMAYGRACLLGDAAFATRPHAGAATTKAAVDAWSLADRLRESGGDVLAALRAWEPQQLEVGRTFLARNRSTGRLSLVENRFDPADPAIQPGLYAPGR